MHDAIPEAGAMPPPLTNGAGRAPPGGDGASAEGRFVLVPRADLPPLRKHPPETIARARARALYVETTRSVVAIAAEVGVGHATVSNWAKTYNWPPRREGAPRPTGPRKARVEQNTPERLRRRMNRALGRQLAQLEKRGAKSRGIPEKDARTLGLLARTLETLMQLDRNDGAKVKPPETRDRGYLREALARRIAAWAEEGEETATPDRSDT